MIPLYFPPINAFGNIAFRSLILKNKADFVFTEMVNIEKLIKGVKYQFDKLKILENDLDKTFVQIICEDSSNILKGIDLIMNKLPLLKEINYNMGCPRSSLASKDWGGGILSDPSKVYKVSLKLKKACDKYNIRASVKIRLGVNKDNKNLLENIKQINKAGIKKIYIHCRYLSDSYNKPASYSEIKDIKNIFPEIEIIANGDVVDSITLNKIISETNCDGVMIGRSALKDPSIFRKLKKENYIKSKTGEELKTKIPLMKEFIKISKLKEINLTLPKIKANLVFMTQGVVKGNEFRKKLNNCLSIKQVNELLDKL